MVDVLGDLRQEVRDLLRRIRVLESASPLGYSSISEGALEIRSEEGLIVEGSARISGVLNGDGTFDWTGPMNLAGDQTVAGDVTYTGQLTVNGPWKFVGNGELTGDMNVKAGGRIVIEGGDQIVLEQSGGVARVKMGASEIRGGDGIGLYPNSGPAIISTTAGLRVATLPTISGASVGLPPDTIYVSSTGFLYKTF